MGVDSRSVELTFTVSTVRAIQSAIAGAVTKKHLNLREQTYCVEFDTYAGLRLSQLPVLDLTTDNRELVFTLTVEACKALVTAIDSLLASPEAWDIVDRRCDDAKTYLNAKIEAMPALLKQGKMKL